MSVLPLSLNTLKALRFLQRCERIEDAIKLRLDEETLTEMRRLMEALLQYVLDREPRGSRFLGQVSQSSRSGAASSMAASAAGGERA